MRLGSDTDWTAVAGGSAHGIALKRDGSLWAWGYNEFGQAAAAPGDWVLTPTQVGDALGWKAIATGRSHNLAIR